MKPDSRSKQRLCLRCHRPFLSQHAAVRLCDPCRGSNVEALASMLPVPGPPLGKEEDHGWLPGQEPFEDHRRRSADTLPRKHEENP